MGALLLCVNFAKAQENNWTSTRPDGHAPIGVMGDHYHHKGEIMFSYRLMQMGMEGCIEESSDLSNMEVWQKYMAAPQTMNMQMHMLGFMYASSDNITLMAMANYLDNSMDLQTMKGKEFSSASGGLGDVSVSTLIKIINKNQQSLHANVSMSIPTGSLNQRGSCPMDSDVRLGYPMQLGSGSTDTQIGLTYLGQTGKLSWGAQGKYKHRLTDNSESYRLGNVINSTAWFAFKASTNFSFSLRGNYYNIGSISGKDMEIDMMKMMMPLFNTANSGRQQFDVNLGTNFMITEGTFKNLRVGIEVGNPIFQSVNGLQMKNSYFGTVGIQYAFGGHH